MRIPEVADVVGVLLAGGMARRMGGGDKCLQQLGGRSLLAYSIDAAVPQVGPLIINAAGEPSRFNDFDLPVVADVIEGFAGPLAGVLTGLEWARDHIPDARWVVTFPTDAPFFPADLVARLLDETNTQGADMACARSNERTHPVFALWPVRLAGDLRRAMEDEEMRKIDRWTSRYNIVHVDWSVSPNDPFFNINRPEDLEQAEALLGKP
ncbi:MAG: molybdenum cofactor guanylyltransferase MobA [Rhodospirillaceae bacterium]|jgi:molybdenum cofactor guanylyltransferase|nr:molybdenum cofactor guanylyltransferase MobA [Rhodospirillaceae bacterium]MBT5244735.1 molybdenum cofactor guanylyltransferase MobA [Rhodospirillaceae bacterium]MBT5562476.1 molybdenum cofactor guanylyltransferase MobA [Rhodospirillaceae bacterium]MBT6242114.1 molybdenum cofactor guanylyltransferase MobA [Rhodospirillaceae bacterium]